MVAKVELPEVKEKMGDLTVAPTYTARAPTPFFGGINTHG